MSVIKLRLRYHDGDRSSLSHLAIGEPPGYQAASSLATGYQIKYLETVTIRLIISLPVAILRSRPPRIASPPAVWARRPGEDCSTAWRRPSPSLGSTPRRSRQSTAPRCRLNFYRNSRACSNTSWRESLSSWEVSLCARPRTGMAPPTTPQTQTTPVPPLRPRPLGGGLASL